MSWYRYDIWDPVLVKQYDRTIFNVLSRDGKIIIRFRNQFAANNYAKYNNGIVEQCIIHRDEFKRLISCGELL